MVSCQIIIGQIVNSQIVKWYVFSTLQNYNFFRKYASLSYIFDNKCELFTNMRSLGQMLIFMSIVKILGDS